MRHRRRFPGSGDDPADEHHRNFFLGREPVRGGMLTRRIDMRAADAIVSQELARIGIALRDPRQAVGTLSGGERQCVAIARAVWHGAAF